MILLNAVVHIFAGANGNGFASLAEPALRITLQYGYSVGLAAINGNAPRSTVAGQGLADKAFCSGQITMFAEIEINRVTVAVYRTAQIQPLAFDLDVNLIKVSFACDLTLRPIKPFKQFWTEADDPTMDG